MLITIGGIHKANGAHHNILEALFLKRSMENTLQRELLPEVKKKQEFSMLPNKVIEEAIAQALRSYPNIVHPRASQKKILVKEIRAKLRRSTGMFHASAKKRRKAGDDVYALLKTHVSTAERLASYPLLKEKIYSLGIHSILDIGCGLNPLALASPGIAYAACDIRQDEIAIINGFFKKHQISGKAFVHDITKFNNDLPAADLCLLWKVLEITGGDTHVLARHLMAELPCKYLLVSFSTCTLSGKRMKHKRRAWFESILKEQAYKTETFEIPNELFYLIRKRSS